MSNVLLGSIIFQGREVPDVMPWGGRQTLAIHRQLGGSRVIDAMGPDPRPIEWHGRFQGTSATVRARLVDALKDTGARVPLQWGSFSYTVVIADFEAFYKHEWEVTYRIACEVVSQGPPLPAPNLDSVIKTDFSALTTNPTIPLAAQTLIATAQTSISTIAAVQPTHQIADASLAQIQPAIVAAQAAFDSLLAARQAAEGAMSGINLDSFLGSSSVLDGIKLLSIEQANQVVSADLSIALGYMGRVVGNLTSAGG
jgi:hypothetical protein